MTRDVTTLPTQYTSWTELNPGWNINLFDDEQIELWMAHHLTSSQGSPPSLALKAFHDLPRPVLKTDVFRYLVVFIEGGLYTNSDTGAILPIDQWDIGTTQDWTDSHLIQLRLNNLRLATSFPLRQLRFSDWIYAQPYPLKSASLNDLYELKSRLPSTSSESLLIDIGVALAAAPRLPLNRETVQSQLYSDNHGILVMNEHPDRPQELGSSGQTFAVPCFSAEYVKHTQVDLENLFESRLDQLEHSGTVHEYLNATSRIYRSHPDVLKIYRVMQSTAECLVYHGRLRDDNFTVILPPVTAVDQNAQDQTNNAAVCGHGLLSLESAQQDIAGPCQHSQFGPGKQSLLIAVIIPSVTLLRVIPSAFVSNKYLSTR
ncbi:MAG: hypothetical protein M1812_007501 [Candelaria pacifica]|nr:MAG: hypothetical protein M1812_007501 [Candelaria pacifica]